jgi:hypothetical protein
MKYLHALYTGNPCALWFIFGCVLIGVLALYLTPLCDAEFDRCMAELEEDERSRYPLSEEEDLEMLYARSK